MGVPPWGSLRLALLWSRQPLLTRQAPLPAGTLRTEESGPGILSGGPAKQRSGAVQGAQGAATAAGNGGCPSPQPPQGGPPGPNRGLVGGVGRHRGLRSQGGMCHGWGWLLLSEVQPPPPLLAEWSAFPPLWLRARQPLGRRRGCAKAPGTASAHPPAQRAGRPGDSEAGGAGPS